MLQAEHAEQQYGKPVFGPATKRPRSHERIVQRAFPVFDAATPRLLVSLGDSEEMSLSEVARYSNKRTDLALRKLRGEPLTTRERLLLSILNRLTRLVVTAPSRLEPEGVEAMDEFRRWQAARSGRGSR